MCPFFSYKFFSKSVTRIFFIACLKFLFNHSEVSLQFSENFLKSYFKISGKCPRHFFQVCAKFFSKFSKNKYPLNFRMCLKNTQHLRNLRNITSKFGKILVNFFQPKFLHFLRKLLGSLSASIAFHKYSHIIMNK